MCSQQTVKDLVRNSFLVWSRIFIYGKRNLLSARNHYYYIISYLGDDCGVYEDTRVRIQLDGRRHTAFSIFVLKRGRRRDPWHTSRHDAYVRVRSAAAAYRSSRVSRRRAMVPVGDKSSSTGSSSVPYAAEPAVGSGIGAGVGVRAGAGIGARVGGVGAGVAGIGIGIGIGAAGSGLPEPVDNPKERLKECCRKLVAFMCTQVGVGGLVVGYAVVGAFCFIQIEGQAVDAQQHTAELLRHNCSAGVWNATSTFNVLSQKNWTRQVNEVLKHFEQSLALIVKRGYDGKTAEETWSFSAALMFSLSIFTMNGYGNVVPKTSLGKAATVVYAVFGIPLYVLYFRNMGKVRMSY